MSSRPNVLILMSDQHRHDIAGCYGNARVQTPNIDALARRGTRFTNAFCTSPLCGPSRASFLTGTYPHTNGLINHPNQRHRSGKSWRPQLRAGIASLVGGARDAGYRTHASGYLGMHLFDGERDLDYDTKFLGFQTLGQTTPDYARCVGEEVSRAYNMGRIHGEMWEPSYFNVEGEAFPHAESVMWDSLIARNCVDFLAQRDASQPFFAYCGFRAPHPPWRAPERWMQLYDPAQMPIPDYRVRHEHKPRRLMERFDYFDIRDYPEDWVRRSIAAYYAMVSYTDDCVGRVLAKLEELGLTDETLVIYASDHGENLYQHGLCEKHTLFDSSVRIPLIFSLPGVFGGDQTVTALAENQDILPTVLDVIGLPLPDFAEGQSLLPPLSGEAVRSHVKSEYYHSLDPCRMVRDERFKYIHTEDDICELYDLQNDPEERENLAWFPEYAGLVAQMERAVMEDWEIPEVPLESAWNDLNERKQKQRLQGLTILDARQQNNAAPLDPPFASE